MKKTLKVYSLFAITSVIVILGCSPQKTPQLNTKEQYPAPQPNTPWPGTVGLNKLDSNIQFPNLKEAKAEVFDVYLEEQKGGLDAHSFFLMKDRVEHRQWAERDLFPGTLREDFSLVRSGILNNITMSANGKPEAFEKAGLKVPSGSFIMPNGDIGNYKSWRVVGLDDVLYLSTFEPLPENQMVRFTFTRMTPEQYREAFQ